MNTPSITPPAPSQTNPGVDPGPATALNEATQQIFGIIAQQAFFQGMSDPQLQVLAASAMVIEFKADEWILRQGDPANRFYLILEGKVVIESEVKEQATIPIRTLGPGEDLGWAWMFPPYYLQFSARALEPVKAIFFYGTRLRQQCEEDHELGYELMRRIAQAVMLNLNATQERLKECADEWHTKNTIPAATALS